MSGALGLTLILSLLFSSCFEKERKNSYGMSFIPRTEFSYRGAVDRSIELKFDVQKSAVSEITAIAILPEGYKGSIKYKWSLGDGVKIEQGSLDGELTPQKQKIIFQIKVTGFTADLKKHIRFEVLGDALGRRTFADGIISSQQENSFEEIVKEIENYKKEIANEK